MSARMAARRVAILQVACLGLAAVVNAQTAPEKPAPPCPPERSAAPCPPPEPTVSWEDGETRLRFRDGELKLSNRLQARWTREDPVGELGAATADADIPRARTSLEGWLFIEAVEFELTLDWAEEASKLKDASLEWDPTGNKLLRIKAGHFKAPFGRQEMTSSAKQQFVDRSEVTDEFAGGRHLAVEASGEVVGGRLEYHAGLFRPREEADGVRDSRTRYVGRLTYQPFGEVKYSESDFDSRGTALVAFGAGINHLDGRGSAPFDDERATTVGLDAALKTRGFSLFGEVFLREVETSVGAVARGSGFQLQGGYFLLRDRLEVAARVGAWDKSHIDDAEARTETGIGLNLYLRKHGTKLQGDLRRLDGKAGEPVEYQIRTQLQFVF